MFNKKLHKELNTLKHNYNLILKENQDNKRTSEILANIIGHSFIEDYNKSFIGNYILKDNKCYIINEILEVIYSPITFEVIIIRISCIKIDLISRVVINSDIETTCTNNELLHSNKLSAIDSDRIESIIKNIADLHDLELFKYE